MWYISIICNIYLNQVWLWLTLVINPDSGSTCECDDIIIGQIFQSIFKHISSDHLKRKYTMFSKTYKFMAKWSKSATFLIRIHLTGEFNFSPQVAHQEKNSDQKAKWLFALTFYRYKLDFSGLILIICTRPKQIGPNLEGLNSFWPLEGRGISLQNLLKWSENWRNF